MCDTLETALAKDFGSVDQVRHVLTEWADRSLLVWISIDDPRPGVRDRIYQKELELMSGFPEIDFDFNLINSMGRSAEEIAGGGPCSLLAPGINGVPSQLDHITKAHGNEALGSDHSFLCRHSLR